MTGGNQENLNEKQEDEFTEDDPLRSQDVKEVSQPSVCAKFCHLIKNMTVEASLLFLIMSSLISMLTTQNLSLEKACRVNLNFSDEICTSLKLQDVNSQNQYEKETQKLLASVMAKRTYISATIPCVIALLVGAWSDKTGHRKVFLTISIFGQFLITINNMLNVYFFHELSVEVLVFSEAILESFSGGWCVGILTAFSYISAITSDEDRTYRMGLLNFCMTVGFPVGMGLSGILLKKYGYYGSYGLAGAIHSLNVMYSIFVLKDPKRNKEQKKHDKQGIRHFFRTFFDFANVKDTVGVVFKKAPNNRRVRLCILLAVVTVLFGPMYGEVSILYLSTRYRFNWDEIKFSIFQTYNFVTHTVGTIFSILFFSKYLKWDDSILGIISTISKIAGSFVYCFAPNDKIFFIAPLVEILNGTALLAMRSIFSKMVQPDELGKMNSVVGLTENLMPLLYVPLYTKVYTSTMEVLPGAVFLMGALMTLPAVGAFIWLFVEHRLSLRKTKSEIENQSPD